MTPRGRENPYGRENGVWPPDMGESDREAIGYRFCDRMALQERASSGEQNARLERKGGSARKVKEKERLATTRGKGRKASAGATERGGQAPPPRRRQGRRSEGDGFTWRVVRCGRIGWRWTGPGPDGGPRGGCGWSFPGRAAEADMSVTADPRIQPTTTLVEWQDLVGETFCYLSRCPSMADLGKYLMSQVCRAPTPLGRFFRQMVSTRTAPSGAEPAHQRRSDILPIPPWLGDSGSRCGHCV